MAPLHVQSPYKYSDIVVQKIDEKLQMTSVIYEALRKSKECSIQKAIALAPSVIHLLDRFIEDGVESISTEQAAWGSGISHVDDVYEVLPEIIKAWRKILKQKGVRYNLEHKFRSDVRPARFQINEIQNLKGIEYVECKSEREEALCILIRVMEVLKRPDTTIAIISDDPKLIKIISSLSKLCGLEIKNSFGIPFKEIDQIDFIRLILETVRQKSPPAHLLALLRHKIFGFGKKEFDLASLIEKLEQKYMRGIRKYEDLKALAECVSENQLKIFLWLLHEEMKKFIELMSQDSVSFEKILMEVAGLALRLGSQPEDNIFKKLGEIRIGEIRLAPDSFLKLFDSLIANEMFCEGFNGKARVKIFSVSDNEFLQSDHIILTGMNEESFFKNRSYDAKFIRGIYEILGVRSHDPEFARIEKTFIDLVTKRNLLITRASMVDGAPQPPSRLLVKLELLARKLQEKDFYNTDLLKEARSIHQALEFTKNSQPAPAPPAEHRLKKLSVTQVEKLIRDPYSVYALYILKLRKLEEVDKALDNLEFGKFIHGTIDRFSRSYVAGKEAEHYFEAVMDCGRKQLSSMIKFPLVRVIWLAQLKKTASWVINFEAMKHVKGKNIKIYTEEKGEIKILLEDGNSFTLTCKADRIEILDGHATIIDFKTGSIPSKSDVLSGASPQLPLEALILLEKGFDDLPKPKLAIDELNYISLSTGIKFGDITSIKENLEQLISQTRAGLKNLIEFYSKPTTPFLACPNPNNQPSHNEYSHLERIQEL
jgi:ATP-dependent helicase/nuclease subunit B